MTPGNQILVASSFLSSSSHHLWCFPLHRFVRWDWLKCSQKSGQITYGIVARTKGQLDERDAGFFSAECVRLLCVLRRAQAQQLEHADKWTGETYRPSWEACSFPEPLLISVKASIKYKQFAKMPSEFVSDLNVLCTCSKLKRSPTLGPFSALKIKGERAQWF